MVDERIAARRAEVRDHRRRRRLRRTVLVASLVALALAAFAVERSSLVALEEVRVTGTERLDPATVREAAALELGTSTLRLRLDAARRRVEALPLVASAELTRVDPLTVQVAVSEREPELVVVRGDTRVLVDADGVVVADGAEPGLPRVRLVSGAPPEVGSTLAEVPPAASAQQVWQQLPGAIRARIDLVVARAVDDVVLRLDTGAAVLVGRPEQMDEKARALGAVLEDLGTRSVQRIDVRVPSRPVVDP